MYGYRTYVEERDAKKAGRDYLILERSGLLGDMTDNEVACGPLCKDLFRLRDDLREAAQRGKKSPSNTQHVIDGFRRVFQFGEQHGVIDGVPDDDTIYELIISDDKQTSMGLSELMRAVPLGFCGPDSMRRFTESLENSFPMDAYRDEFDMYLFEDACRRDIELWGRGYLLSMDEVNADKRAYMLDVEELEKSFGHPISRECVCNIGEMLLGSLEFKKFEAQLAAEEEAEIARFEAAEREQDEMLRLIFGDEWVAKRNAPVTPRDLSDEGGVGLGD